MGEWTPDHNTGLVKLVAKLVESDESQVQIFEPRSCVRLVIGINGVTAAGRFVYVSNVGDSTELLKYVGLFARIAATESKNGVEYFSLTFNKEDNLMASHEDKCEEMGIGSEAVADFRRS